MSKPPKHSKAAIKAHPAPVRIDGEGYTYAMECLACHDARIAFDKPKPKYDRVAIINKIADGLAIGTTLRSMCREEGMPGYQTIYNWINDDPEISGRIARAREAGYDAIADQIIEIIDESHNDTIVNEDGTERTNTEVVARSRLRAEIRLKLLAKWSPKKYGDKVDLNVGGQTDNPFQAVVAASSELEKFIRKSGSD